MIQNPSDVQCSKIEFSPVKVLDNGGKSVNLRYDGRNLMLETPSLSLPFGVNIFDKNGPPKYSADLSFRGADDDEKVRALQTFFEEFDERMIDAGVENAQKWWKMTNPSREVVKAFYTPMVKISRDQAGNPKPYPPVFKVALRKKKDGKFETDFYNGAVKPLVAYDKEDPIEQILCKRSQVTSIVQCTGVWFAGGKFGTTWKAVQMRVDSQPEQIRGPAFRNDAPDIRAFVSRALPKAAATEEEEDEGDEGEEVLAAVLPPPPNRKAPAPPAFAEEENVEDAVPVPRKVVKKPAALAKKA